MGRPAHSRALAVWSNGIRIATWRLPSRGRPELAYEQAWADSPAGRPLSLSLPFGLGNAPLKGAAVDNYFDNLLPDSDAIRRRLGNRFRTPSLAAFDLLAAIGRDCAGAVQLLPEDEAPAAHDRIEGVPLSEDEVAAHLDGIVGPPAPGLDGGGDFRISIAGAQEKTALLWHGADGSSRNAPRRRPTS